MPRVLSLRPADGRADTLLARVRSKQLEFALHGRVVDSARYALRAERIRKLRQTAARN